MDALQEIIIGQWWEVITVVFLALSKTLLLSEWLRGKPVLKEAEGWIISFVAEIMILSFYGAQSSTYFVLVGFESCVFLSVLYGWIKWKQKISHKRTLIDFGIEILSMVVIVFSIIWYLFFHEISFSFLMQAILASTFIMGTILIARKKPLGWIFYFVAHGAAILIFWKEGRAFLFYSQIYSLVVAAIGIYKFRSLKV